MADVDGDAAETSPSDKAKKSNHPASNPGGAHANPDDGLTVKVLFMPGVWFSLGSFSYASAGLSCCDAAQFGIIT